MRTRIVWLIAGLLVGVVAGAGGYGVYSANQEVGIEKTTAAKPDAGGLNDVNDRIAANWGTLAADPASPVIGNPNGDVTLVEFFDYACVYCKAAEPRLLAAVAGDKQVRLVLKEFPILTPESMIASRVALAAQHQGKYQPFHSALMAYQGPLTEQVIFDTAQQVGLDMAHLKQDMQAPEVTAQIIANYNLARAIQAFQTPTYVVGGAAGSHVLSSTSASIDFPREIAAARKR